MSDVLDAWGLKWLESRKAMFEGRRRADRFRAGETIAEIELGEEVAS